MNHSTRKSDCRLIIAIIYFISHSRISIYDCFTLFQNKNENCPLHLHFVPTHIHFLISDMGLISPLAIGTSRRSRRPRHRLRTITMAQSPSTRPTGPRVGSPCRRRRPLRPVASFTLPLRIRIHPPVSLCRRRRRSHHHILPLPLPPLLPLPVPQSALRAAAARTRLRADPRPVVPVLRLRRLLRRRRADRLASGMRMSDG